MEKHGRSIEYCNLYWKKKCLEVTIDTKAIMVIFEGIQTGYLSERMGKVVLHTDIVVPRTKNAQEPTAKSLV